MKRGVTHRLRDVHCWSMSCGLPTIGHFHLAPWPFIYSYRCSVICIPVWSPSCRYYLSGSVSPMKAPQRTHALTSINANGSGASTCIFCRAFYAWLTCQVGGREKTGRKKKSAAVSLLIFIDLLRLAYFLFHFRLGLLNLDFRVYDFVLVLSLISGVVNAGPAHLRGSSCIFAGVIQFL